MEGAHWGDAFPRPRPPRVCSLAPRCNRFRVLEAQESVLPEVWLPPSAELAGMVSSLGGVGEAAQRGVASISPKVLVQEYLLLVSESWQLAAWRFNAVILFSHVKKPPGVKEGGSSSTGAAGMRKSGGSRSQILRNRVRGVGCAPQSCCDFQGVFTPLVRVLTLRLNQT